MLIFLDIDGVLVSGAGWKIPELLEDGFAQFTPKSVQALQSLITFETTIILSSSHRNRFSIDQWKTIFGKRGVHVEKLKLLGSNHNSRKEEILEWFNNYQSLRILL